MSELTERLITEAKQNRGTDLGGLLQWAALHIANQDEALAESRAQLERLEQDHEALQDGLKAASDAVETAAKCLQAARPVDMTEQFSRDFCGHINLMAGLGDKDYLRPNGQSVRHVDLREARPRPKQPKKAAA